MAYSDASCPTHSATHHPQPQPQGPQPAAAAADPVVTVHRLQGWAAVPADQLPPWFVQDVQAIQLLDGGGVVFPVRRVDGGGPQVMPPVPVPVPAHPCQREDCHELLTAPHLFCSMRCHHHHLAG
ncbi:hypothetical protein BS78_09G031000 [Paspalum vaginatum]|nr:hypothetical protein BS78_09G031000 [Paspalum vaginatum]